MFNGSLDASMGREATPILAAAQEKDDPERLMKFPAYDKDFHQSQDNMIQRVVAEFNASKGLDSSSPHYLNPNLVKAWALQESGGHYDEFTKGDMMQVNNPGDWTREKEWFGLQRRQQMDPEKSLRAALEWAWYKGQVTRPMQGDTVSDGWHPTKRGTKSVPGYESQFTGWEKALDKYNGGGVENYFGEIDTRLQTGEHQPDDEAMDIPSLLRAPQDMMS